MHIVLAIEAEIFLKVDVFADVYCLQSLHCCFIQDTSQDFNID